jgi:hypothetical protein
MWTLTAPATLPGCRGVLILVSHLRQKQEEPDPTAPSSRTWAKSVLPQRPTRRNRVRKLCYTADDTLGRRFFRESTARPHSLTISRNHQRQPLRSRSLLCTSGQLEEDSRPLSAFIRTHVGLDRRYSFVLPDLGGRPRPLRDHDTEPTAAQ